MWFLRSYSSVLSILLPVFSHTVCAFVVQFVSLLETPDFDLKKQAFANEHIWL